MRDKNSPSTKLVKGDNVLVILVYDYKIPTSFFYSLKSILDKISEPVGCGKKSTISAFPANNGVE